MPLVLRFLDVVMFYQQLSSGEIAPFSLVQLEVIFNPTKPGNALAEFEISFSDPLSPPVSTNIICVSSLLSYNVMGHELCFESCNHVF